MNVIINVRNQFLFRFNVGKSYNSNRYIRNKKWDEEKYTVDNQGFFLSVILRNFKFV